MKMPVGQTIVMFCGADRCGKTNIARELSLVTGIPYFKARDEHATYLNDKDAFVKQLRYADPRLCDFVRQTRQSVIMDRAYPCEWSYSKVMGRETDTVMLNKMDAAWATMDTRIVFCYRSSYEGIVDDLDPNITAPVLQALTNEYRNFSAATRCQKLWLNVDDENLNREVNEVLTFMGCT